jgi:hypothetical protein
MLRQGMTKNEVIGAVGSPSAHKASYGGSCNYGLNIDSCQTWYYGSVAIYFSDSGLVTGGSACR